MSVETWGLEQKAQDDPQTIDEAIAAAVLAHEQDPDAHLGAGESLDSHRASEIIDHLAESIVTDKLEHNFFFNKLNLTQFYSLDVFDISAFATELTLMSIYLTTSTTKNNEAYLGPKNGYLTKCDFLKNPILNVPLLINVVGTHLVYFGLGDKNETYDNNFAGFKVSGGHIYARTYKDSTSHETLVDLGVFVSGVLHTYRIEVYSGVRVDFYIDNSFVATITTNLPNDTQGYSLFIYLKTTQAGQNVSCTFYPFSYQQDP